MSDFEYAHSGCFIISFLWTHTYVYRHCFAHRSHFFADVLSCLGCAETHYRVRYQQTRATLLKNRKYRQRSHGYWNVSEVKRSHIRTHLAQLLIHNRESHLSHLKCMYYILSTGWSSVDWTKWALSTSYTCIELLYLIYNMFYNLFKLFPFLFFFKQHIFPVNTWHNHYEKLSHVFEITPKSCSFYCIFQRLERKKANIQQILCHCLFVAPWQSSQCSHDISDQSKDDQIYKKNARTTNRMISLTNKLTWSFR